MKTAIEMALEVGFTNYITEKNRDLFERFFEIVSANEREACAKLAKNTVCDVHIPTGVKIYGTAAAKAIRERGKS